MDRRTVLCTLTALGSAAGAAGTAKADVFGGGRGLGGRPAWAVAADGLRLRYETLGQGPVTLVLVHGWTCDRTYWIRQAAALAGDYRIVAMDLAGHGESDKGRSVWSMEGLGDDVARVVEAAGARQVVLVGHSMGGPVVIEAARRLGPRVAGVVTVDILQQPDVHMQSTSTIDPATYATKTRADLRSAMFSGSDPAIADRIAAAMTSGSPQIAIGLAEALGRYDALAGLAAIAALPLTMIDADKTPVHVEAIRGVHPGARLLVVHGVGHFVMIDAPATFNSLLTAEAQVVTRRVTSL